MCSERRNFAYVRVAGKEDAEKNIIKQRECIQLYRSQHPNLPEYFEEVTDVGYSGLNDTAPGLRKILQLVEQNKVGTIIVSDLSRLTRDYKKASYYMDVLFPRHDVQLLIFAQVKEDRVGICSKCRQ